MGQRPPLSDMPLDQLKRQARKYRRMADQARSKPLQNAYLRLEKRYERLAAERKARDEKEATELASPGMPKAGAR
jgi:hypothetical protein